MHLIFEILLKNICLNLREEGGKDLTMKKARINIHLIPFFDRTPLDKISTFDVERYKKHRLEEGAAKGTVNRELAALSHLFSKAIEWHWIDKKPAIIRRFKEDQARFNYLTVEQIQRIYEIAKNDQNHTFIHLWYRIRNRHAPHGNSFY